MGSLVSTDIHLQCVLRSELSREEREYEDDSMIILFDKIKSNEIFRKY